MLLLKLEIELAGTMSSGNEFHILIKRFKKNSYHAQKQQVIYSAVTGTEPKPKPRFLPENRNRNFSRFSTVFFGFGCVT